MKPTEASLRSLEKADWTLDGKTIRKRLEFDSFSQAFAFMTQVAFLAETAGHHPDWSNSYNVVEISLTTHDAQDLTEKDIALAQQIDALLGA